MEEQSLTEGAPRIKFACHAVSAPLEASLGKELLARFSALADSLADAVVLMEESGATPVLSDGLVAGNCSALLLTDEPDAEESLMVSKSGKAAGLRPTKDDFVAVQSFDTDAWSCDFCPAAVGSRPTSDTPLHWACLKAAAKEFGWAQRPLVALHGHALAEKEGLKVAESLGLPISNEETLFSTPEDVQALMALFRKHAYPEHKVFIRRGHGFLILSDSVEGALIELRKLIPYFKPEEACEGSAPS
ncbi:unnamed protein product [Polarella glacialis]|uniref:Uncharacterized protein n=1 Tax=Polarella glacialis TaxID=89957 RepID=A0A813KKN8_POLGL|nr:unnamed protein product [Polarella glacialis]|mmetsp:Transcript_50937/g.82666  ORF Transcript_50937/g.82666 Transcript_50937/m.82666 type:complete len:246 (+) Transcript_50937:114-851(+)